MCGIAGVYYFGEQVDRVCESDVKIMTDVISHRGPDGEGVWIHDNGFLGFGHRRLSIIDLSDAASQPFQAFGYTITYNGEIYNYLELKKDLISQGYQFYTDSDTEVILACYNKWGKECLQFFDGMWSFAIWDENKQELFCARDRFGEKPFHYYFDKEKFIFGSEMKSLFNAGVPRNVNSHMMYLFINMDLHENPNDTTETFFNGVYRLDPASYIVIRKGEYSPEPKQVKYWDLNIEEKETISFDKASETFRHLFFESVSRRLRSDVPVGTSLSGGLDSSAVVAVIHHLTGGKVQQKCFSARFNDTRLDEGAFMKMMVDKTGFEHKVTFPNADNIINDMHKVLFHQEEPFGSASVNAQWEVFKLAKQNDVTVLLDGQGADETLAGYTHFFTPFLKGVYLKRGYDEMMREYSLYKDNNIVNKLLKISLMFRMEARYPLAFEEIRKAKRSFYGAAKNIEIHDDLFCSFKKGPSVFTQYNELKPSLKHYTTVSGLSKLLRFADRNSMAHSREVRLPFLSTKIVEFVFGLPDHCFIRNGWTKPLIRYGLQDLLPEEITWRKNKLGFQPPQDAWFSDEKLKNAFMDYHTKAIAEKMISSQSPLSWKSVMTGMFIDVS